MSRFPGHAARATTLLGLACAITGVTSHATTAFAAPPVQPAPTVPPRLVFPKGVLDVKVTGFGSSVARGAIEIRGIGPCRFRVDILDLARPNAAASPVFRRMFDAATLPVTIPDAGPLPNGTYRVYLIGYDQTKCPIQGPDKRAGGWYVDFKVGTGIPAPTRPAPATPAPAGTPSGSGQPPGGGAPPAPGGLPSGTKPATGNITGMSVPGGSFAEDEAQKLQVLGSGGCGFDLQISNKTYGGTYDKTVPVAPMKLGPSTLYNGTHFGTIGEGSYKATATGKNGCTGVESIDFKVTAKTSTKKVLGKPVLTFDQQPKSGNAFMASKDSNIWFKVAVTQSVKDEPYASCCDVEFDYQNEYGGWEPLPNSPFQDASWSLAVKQPAAVVNKSVSYFSQGTLWRVKVRAYKFRTEFEWSDWVEFRVNQN